MAAGVSRPVLARPVMAARWSRPVIARPVVAAGVG